MAKKPKVPLNVLVVEGTRSEVRRLAEVLECSQGEVVDRAVVLLGTNDSVAKGLSGVSVLTRLVADPDGPHDLITPRGGAMGIITVDPTENSATVNLTTDRATRQPIPKPKDRR